MFNPREHPVRNSYFLTPDFNWTRGPDLPHGKIAHASVAIDDSKVVIFGGKYSSAVWIYDDQTKTFEAKTPFSVGFKLAAAKIGGFSEIEGEVILVKGDFNELYTYDWKSDVWTTLSEDWYPPSAYHYFTVLVQLGKRWVNVRKYSWL